MKSQENKRLERKIGFKILMFVTVVK